MGPQKQKLAKLGDFSIGPTETQESNTKNSTVPLPSQIKPSQSSGKFSIRASQKSAQP